MVDKSSRKFRLIPLPQLSSVRDKHPSKRLLALPPQVQRQLADGANSGGGGAVAGGGQLEGVEGMLFERGVVAMLAQRLSMGSGGLAGVGRGELLSRLDGVAEVIADLLAGGDNQGPEVDPDFAMDDGGGESEFAKAWKHLERQPSAKQDNFYRMLARSDDSVERLLYVAKIVAVQSMIRSFLARMRVKRMRAHKSEGATAAAAARRPLPPEAPQEGELSEFERAWLAMQQAPDETKDKMYRMLGSSHESVEALLHLSRVVAVQCMIRRFLARKKVNRIRQQRGQ